MWKTTLLFILLILLLSFGARASVPNSPEDFLSEVLAMEFKGEHFRVGKVIFTGKKSSMVGDCDCAVPRELAEVGAAPIVIVSKLSVAKKADTKDDGVYLKANFRVLADTKGDGDLMYEGGRRIVPLSSPRDEVVTYHLRLKGGQWFLVDPPKPRVGIETVISVLQDNVDSYAKKSPPLYVDAEKNASAERKRAINHAEFQKQVSILQLLLKAENDRNVGK